MISTMERVGNRGIRNLIAQSHPLVETTDTISPNKDINHVLRAHDCKYRESLARLKKSKILITCQKSRKPSYLFWEI